MLSVSYSVIGLCQNCEPQRRHLNLQCQRQPQGVRVQVGGSVFPPLLSIAPTRCYKCGKAISITYLCVCMCVRECVHVVLLIQHATRVRHTVTSFVASGCTIFFDIILRTAPFSEKSFGT